MDEVTLRAAGPPDIEPAVQVWIESNTARRAGRPVPDSHVTRVRGHFDNPTAFPIVAEMDGDVVGMGIGMQALDDDGAGPPVPGLCHISMVFVASDHWGKGIGGLIVERLKQDARVRGFAKAQLWTHADNERGQRLYDRKAFTLSGRDKLDDFGDRIIHYEIVL